MSEEAGPDPRPKRRLRAHGSLRIGRFTTVPQANRAITAAAWVLIAFGVLPLSSLLTGARDPFMIATASGVAALFGLPGLFLLLRRSPLAANMALGVCLVLLGLMVVGFAASFSSQDNWAFTPMALSAGLLFGAVTFLCWRARGAARFLKPLKDPAVFD